MAIAKEDIKDGWYWARNKKGELSVVRVALEPTFEIEDGEFLRVAQHEWEFTEPVENFDFIARIEPPEGV